MVLYGYFIKISSFFNKIYIILILLLLCSKASFQDFFKNLKLAAFCSNYHTLREKLDNYENNYHPTFKHNIWCLYILLVPYIDI
jgi:hypothetical protein